MPGYGVIQRLRCLQNGMRALQKSLTTHRFTPWRMHHALPSTPQHVSAMTRKCSRHENAHPSFYSAAFASLSSPYSLISLHSACLTCENVPPPTHLKECEGMGRCVFMKITGILSNIVACWKEGGYFGEGNGVTWHTVPCEHSAHTTRPQARQ
jgi:hypothetical protein